MIQRPTFQALALRQSEPIHCDEWLKLETSVLNRWLIYLIDLVVDNLLECFTFPPTQHTVSFESKSTLCFLFIAAAMQKFNESKQGDHAELNHESPEGKSVTISEESRSQTTLGSSEEERSTTTPETINNRMYRKMIRSKRDSYHPSPPFFFPFSSILWSSNFSLTAFCINRMSAYTFLFR